MRKLSLVIDPVAAMRQLRRVAEPDPVTVASLAELAGVSGVIAHLREDRRFVQERDLKVLRHTVKTHYSLRLPPLQEMIAIAYEIKPDSITFVPEQRDEGVTAGGLDVHYRRDHLSKHIQSIRDADIPVSVFIEPTVDQVRAAHRMKISQLVFDTSKFSDAWGSPSVTDELAKLSDAARAASKLGFHIAAGHGLTLQNIKPLLDIEYINEFQVGHGVIARALYVGIENAVKDFVALIR